MKDDKTADLDKSSESDNKNNNSSNQKTVILKGSIIGNVLLSIAVIFLSLLLCRHERKVSEPTPIDTTKTIIPAIFDSTVKDVKLPKKTGVATPTAETTIVIKTVPKVIPIDGWRVYLVKYLNDALNVVALRPRIEGDSVWHEVWSGTYNASGGFQMIVTDSIRVDTFPHYDPPSLPKEKFWHWKASIGFCWLAYDTSFTTLTRPHVRVGGELGPLRLGRTSITLTPAQLMWFSGGKSSNGVLAAGAEIEVKF